MEFKIIIGAVTVIILFYFRFGKGSRFFKKNTHHYIVPTVSEMDSDSINVQIKSNQYTRYILIKNTTESYIINV